MEIEREVGYFAVIPASVLLSQEISASSKLLYGVVSALARADGYCWASNERLAAILRCGERSVSRGIAELMKAGEIVEEIAPSKERKGNRERRLYTRESYARGVAKIGETANFGETGLAKIGETLYMYDNKSLNIPPITPPCEKTHQPPSAKWKPERFEAFWKFYRQNIHPSGRAAALKAWDKLRPDEDTIIAIGKALAARLKTDSEWARGIGRPHASTYLNGRAWEDDWRRDAPAPSRAAPEPQEEVLGVWK